MSSMMTSLEELGEALGPYLEADPALEEAFHQHASAVMDLLEVPMHIEVGVEHWRAAVALATAFVDGDLFVSELSAESRASAGDPARRAAVIYALVQLISDVLDVAVSEEEPETEDADRSAAMSLLARLALVRGVS